MELLGRGVADDPIPYFFTDQYEIGMEYTGWLAAELAVSGNRNLRGDAATAALLCQATALAAAVMVSENLGSNSVDPRIQQARSACLAAGEAARRTLRLFPAADQSAAETTD